MLTKTIVIIVAILLLLATLNIFLYTKYNDYQPNLLEKFKSYFNEEVKSNGEPTTASSTEGTANPTS